MELLKRLLPVLLFAVISMSHLSVSAQDDLTRAFSESYVLEKKGEYKKAIDQLKAVYREESYETNLRLGWLTYQSGQFYESIAFYNKAIELMPYGIEARFGLAYPVYALGRTDEIISIYQKVLDTDPQNTIALYWLGYIYYYKGSYEKAEQYLEKVVNLYPFDYDSVILLAWTKYRLQKTREAKVLFGKALLYDPESSSAKEGMELVR